MKSSDLDVFKVCIEAVRVAEHIVGIDNILQDFSDTIDYAKKLEDENEKLKALNNWLDEAFHENEGHGKNDLIAKQQLEIERLKRELGIEEPRGANPFFKGFKPNFYFNTAGQKKDGDDLNG